VRTAEATVLLHLRFAIFAATVGVVLRTNVNGCRDRRLLFSHAKV